MKALGRCLLRDCETLQRFASSSSRGAAVMDRLNKIGMSHSDSAAGKIFGLMFKYRPSLRRGHGTADTRHTPGNADSQYHSNNSTSVSVLKIQ